MYKRKPLRTLARVIDIDARLTAQALVTVVRNRACHACGTSKRCVMVLRNTISKQECELYTEVSGLHFLQVQFPLSIP